MTTLPSNQHADIARYFLSKSDREFAAGDVLSGSELLWGAAAHALITVAQRNGWHYDSHGALRNASKQLAVLHQRPRWVTEFDEAEQFHINFYHGQLSDAVIARDRPKVGRFVRRLLSLLMVQ